MEDVLELMRTQHTSHMILLCESFHMIWTVKYAMIIMGSKVVDWHDYSVSS